MQIRIPKRWAVKACWEGEAESLRDAVEWAVKAGAVLTDAVLTGADLTGAVLTGADLTGAVLTGAVLTGADLTGADLTGAVLTGADLTGADLTGADLTGAVLTGAVLTGAKYDRPSDAPPGLELRRLVAEQIRLHPETHDQTTWGDGAPGCGTPCCVAGWTCRLGGGARGLSVSTAATLLLHVDGLPMPPFDWRADRDEILAALDARIGGAS